MSPYLMVVITHLAASPTTPTATIEQIQEMIHQSLKIGNSSINLSLQELRSNINLLPYDFIILEHQIIILISPLFKRQYFYLLHQEYRLFMETSYLSFGSIMLIPGNKALVVCFPHHNYLGT